MLFRSRENIVSFVALASDIELDNMKEREAIENIINSRNSIRKIKVFPENKPMEDKVRDFVNKDLGNLFNNIAYIRNDLNHSGYRENPLPSNTFYKKLDEFISNFEEIIDINSLKLRNNLEIKEGKKESRSKKLFLIFSHKLTDKQREDAKNNLDVEEFIYLPEDLQKIWTNLSPELDDLGAALEEIKSWISKTSSKEDYILVQGDFGATYEMVSFCKGLDLKVIYSTTKRQAHETLRDDGKVQISHLFEHIKFRKY